MARPPKNASGPSATQRMEQAFWDCMRKMPYSEITVRDIVERADVNRNSYYYHYNSMWELARSSVKSANFSAFAHVLLGGFKSPTPTDPAPENETILAEAKNGFSHLTVLASPNGNQRLLDDAKNEVVSEWLDMNGLHEDRVSSQTRSAIDFVFGGISALLAGGQFESFEDMLDGIEESRLIGENLRLLRRDLANNDRLELPDWSFARPVSAERAAVIGRDVEDVVVIEKEDGEVVDVKQARVASNVIGVAGVVQAPAAPVAPAAPAPVELDDATRAEIAAEAAAMVEALSGARVDSEAQLNAEADAMVSEIVGKQVQEEPSDEGAAGNEAMDADDAGDGSETKTAAPDDDGRAETVEDPHEAESTPEAAEAAGIEDDEAAETAKDAQAPAGDGETPSETIETEVEDEIAARAGRAARAAREARERAAAEAAALKEEGYVEKGGAAAGDADDLPDDAEDGYVEKGGAAAIDDGGEDEVEVEVERSSEVIGVIKASVQFNAARKDDDEEDDDQDEDMPQLSLDFNF